MKTEVSDEELRGVIADFLEMGHVENIVSMFKRNPRYYAWTGELLMDQRFNVRLGLTILFEEMQSINPEGMVLAISPLKEVLNNESPLIRGEAVSILGVIGTQEARDLIEAMRNDDNPQVREMVELALSAD